MADEDVLLLEGDVDPDMMQKVRETIETTISGLGSIEQTMETVLKHPDDMPVETAMLVLQTTFVMKQNLVHLKGGIERENSFSENDLARLNLVIRSMNILDAFMKGNIDEGPVNDARDVLKSALSAGRC